MSNYTGFISDQKQVEASVVLSSQTENPSTPPATSATPATPTKPKRTTPSTSTPAPISTPTPTTIVPESLNIRQNVSGVAGLPSAEVAVKKPFISEPLARSISWLLLLILFILAALYGWRARKEYLVRKELERAVARLRGLKLATDSYLEVTTHYLNTPVAIMKGAVELLTSLKKLPDWAIARLQSELGNYAQSVSKLSNETQTVAVTPAPFVGQVMGASQNKSLLQEKTVWLPVAIAVGLFAVCSALFGLNGVYSLASIQFVLQLLCVALFCGLIFMAHRSRNIQLTAQDVARQAAATEQELVDKRTLFLQSAATTLHEHHENLSIIAKDLHFIPETKTFFNGLNMLGAVTTSLQNMTEFTKKYDDSPVLNLGREIPRTLANLQAKAAEKQVQLQLDVPASLGVAMQPQELSQLVSSLADNALSATDANGRVTIAARQSGKWITMSITDTGKGIEPERLAHLFEPFYKAESVETFDHEGLGLNLYINKVIVEKLGGTIDVLSSARGTSVNVRIPASQQDVLRQPAIVAPTLAPASFQESM